MNKLISLKTIIALLLMTLLASCSCSNNAPLRDLEIPSIVSITPTNNARNVVINTFINVNFSEAMDPSSINTNTFNVYDRDGIKVEGNVSYSAESAVFKPEAPLNIGNKYNVSISREMKDVAGNQIISVYTWSFITGAEIDTSVPEFESMSPSPYSNNAPLESDIIITFTKQINLSSVTPASFVVTDIDNQQIEGAFSRNGYEVIFNPTLPFNYSTRYFVTLTTEIQDLSGNNLTEEYRSDFTSTKPPDVIPPLVSSVSPINKLKDVPLNTDIIISFNEDVFPDSVNINSVTITPPFTNTMIVSGESIIIDPDALLSMNTEYRITIESLASETETESEKTAVTDLAGNKLQESFQWGFTTGETEDSVGPSITHINPESDATDVANNNSVTVTFSEPINPATLVGNISIDKAETTIDYSGHTAILRPKQLFANNTTYKVSLSSDITDLSSNKMLTGYSWTFSTGETPDREIPSVTSVFPKNEALNTPINSAIVVRFSESIDPASIHAKSFIVQNSAGEQTIGIMKTIGASVTFHPLEPLKFSENYTVTINTQATDLAENALVEEYSWQFTTSSEADKIPPTILSTVPASSSNFAPTNRGVIVTFSETMDLTTMNSASFYLTNTSGVPIPGSIDYAGNVITLKPNDELAFSRSYIATLTTEVTDISGNALASIHIWSFTTSSKLDQQPPTIISTLPENNAKALIDSGITINFDKNMDAVSLNSATIFLQLDDESKQPVLGTISVTDTSATFTPLAPLEYLTKYTMTVTKEIRDLARNAMQDDYSWSFTTSSTLEAEPPFVISVTPYNKEKKVNLTGSLNVTFSEDIKCNTLNDSNFTLSLNDVLTPGFINCNSKNVTFTAQQALETESTYTATLGTSIGDLHGSPMGETYTWQFTTAPWTQQIGSIASDQGNTITIDNDGNVFTAGTTQGSLADLNNGKTDIYITKHSKNSLILWSKQFGSEEDDVITDITHDSQGNIYLSGYTYGDFAGTNNGSADIIIMKIDTDGKILWQKQQGESQDDIATAITLNQSNQLVITGYSDKNFDGNISSGQHDIIALKLTTDGAQIWSQQFGTINKDIANDIVTDSEDNIYITGYSEGDLGGTGNIGLADITLTKLDTNSVLQWTQQIGSLLRDQTEAIAIDSNDNLYLSGYTSDALDGNTHAGSADQFVIKYDKNGAVLWSKQIGTTENDRANGLTVDNNDDVVIVGYTAGDIEGINFGDNDLTLFKLDTNGETLWTKQYGTEGSDFAFDVTHDTNNNIYIVGQSDAEVDGNRNAGSNDVLIMKWDEDGTKQ